MLYNITQLELTSGQLSVQHVRTADHVPKMCSNVGSPDCTKSQDRRQHTKCKGKSGGNDSYIRDSVPALGPFKSYQSVSAEHTFK